jgi:rubredoxin
MGLGPGSLRFFARIDRFTCECPRCAQVIQVSFDRVSFLRRDAAKGSKKWQRSGGFVGFNPLTQQLICPRCKRTFGVGLLMYPVKPYNIPTQPYDTRPTWEQLNAIRQMAGGYFERHNPIVAADAVNIAVRGICWCYVDEETGGVVYIETCPVHGWKEQLGPKTEEELAKMEQALQELEAAAWVEAELPLEEPAEEPEEE